MSNPADDPLSLIIKGFEIEQESDRELLRLETEHLAKLRELDREEVRVLLELHAKYDEASAKLAKKQNRPIPRFRSPLKKVLHSYLLDHREASDQQLYQWLREVHRELIPEAWNQDDDLPGKYFSKVRRHLPIR